MFSHLYSPKDVLLKITDALNCSVNGIIEIVSGNSYKQEDEPAQQ